jgi:hypothetical protein
MVMNRLEELKSHLKQGRVYRREDMIEWSNAIDRHLEKLVEESVLEKLAQGLYYVPKISAFGKVPPDEDVLVRGFLKDDRFLLVSPNSYNSLGVGTTQLYNKKVVYNHKRHGIFKLGNREFDFQRKYDFPTKITQEFLLVDLVNNLDELAEDRAIVLNKVLSKAKQLPTQKLKLAITKYGSVKAKKLFKEVINKEKVHV